MSGVGWKRWFILFVGLWENLIFSGSILGWSALNFMLKQEGIFVHLCDESVLSSPLPFRNYSIETGIAGQLDKFPLLNSYINYSLLPNVGPSSDLVADAAVPLPQPLALLSLPSSTTAEPLLQSSTFPPVNDIVSSKEDHKVSLTANASTDSRLWSEDEQRMSGSGSDAELGVHYGHLFQRIHGIRVGLFAGQVGSSHRSTPH